MKLLIINNLKSGFGEGSIYDFMRAFAQDGDEICLRSTDGESKLVDLLADAQNFDGVIASGGDGTVAAVSYILRNTGIPILPFPAGTANLLALNLASPIETHALGKMMRKGKQLDFDMGEIEVGGQRFGFSIMAGAGYDAAIMHGAQHTKRFLGPMAYISAAIANPIPQKSHFTIKLDGTTIESDGVGVLLINFSKIQFDLSVTHDNRPRDGALDIVILKATYALQLIPAIVAAALDRDGDFPDRSDALEIHSAREIEVIATPPMEVQYDGETTGALTPFKAHILDKATRLIVSDEGYDLFRESPSKPSATR
ncbi:MAG: diacylglycerol kinase family protein [Raoultibacter sp.]